MGISRRKAILALADGTVFVGRAFGAETETVGEVVFNTSMTGYQEILTDPSYVGQIVTFTYPEQGNVGVNEVDEESFQPHAVGMICKHAALGPIHFQDDLPRRLASQIAHVTVAFERGGEFDRKHLVFKAA